MISLNVQISLVSRIKKDGLIVWPSNLPGSNHGILHIGIVTSSSKTRQENQYWSILWKTLQNFLGFQDPLIVFLAFTIRNLKMVHQQDSTGVLQSTERLTRDNMENMKNTDGSGTHVLFEIEPSYLS